MVMERTSRRLRLCCTALVLILAFIWGNSLLPGELSAAFSQWVKDLLSRIFPGVDPGSEGHGLLRKLAHFSEFACLGACLGWLWGMLANNTAHVLLSAFGCGFTAACVDETIQRFVPGRSSSFTDVMIDSSGVILGIALLALGFYLCKHKFTLKRKGK